jgi:hypothetical protein
MGKNNKGWVADLRWIVKSANFAKIVNGNYIERRVKFNPESYAQCADAERRAIASAILEARHGNRDGKDGVVRIVHSVPVRGEEHGGNSRVG